MTVAFDRVVIAVPQLATAEAQYSALLAAQPAERGAEVSEALFRLGNTVISLVEGAVDSPVITGLVFEKDGHQGPEQGVRNALAVDVATCGAADSAARRESASPVAAGVSVDHVVLQTNDAQGCIDLFSVGLGVRLALDKTVEEWGGRMLFFRAGKMTLEVIASDKTEQSRFWGIAYQCPDIEAFCQRLQQEGIAVSEIRDGRKPGTRVATIKSHCLGIPTLLIEHVK